jgi:hypothetical protein
MLVWRPLPPFIVWIERVTLGYLIEALTIAGPRASSPWADRRCLTRTPEKPIATAPAGQSTAAGPRHVPNMVVGAVGREDGREDDQGRPWRDGARQGRESAEDGGDERPERGAHLL